ncbi:MAG: ATP-binding protein [Candidatus Thorarchaeota archaeon]
MIEPKDALIEFDTSKIIGNHLQWFRLIWLIGILSCGCYLLVVYMLPLIGLLYVVIIPNRLVVELILFALPIISGGALTQYHMTNEQVRISVDDEFLLFEMYDRVIGLVCLELLTVSGSVLTYDEKPMYNTAMLLAIRAGMDKKTNFAYEVSVVSGEPALRIFISASGVSRNEIRGILRREATRTEAILLSSLENVEIRIPKGEDLDEIVQASCGESLVFDDSLPKYDSRMKLLLVQGIPKVTPTEKSSQIGTFISSALKQGYSLSLTCTFSRAKPGKEKREMERKWKSIRAKEKQSEDSLADQARKKELLDKYEEMNANSGWFNSSIYLVVQGDDLVDSKSLVDGVKGLVLSLWGGDDSISVNEKLVNRRLSYKIFMKRHIRSQRLHVGKLAAFVNTPVQPLPVITPTEAPMFQIPSTDLIENELNLGWAVFGGRHLNKVGLRVDWLREHVAVMGATGTGKTTLVKKLVSELSTKTDVPWWIFDVKGSEYSDLSRLGGVTLLRPGLDPTFVIDFFDTEFTGKNQAHSTFSLLRELLQENTSSELSPAMERLLRESVLATAQDAVEGNSIETLVQKVKELAGNDRSGQMTRDALLNRLEVITREPLGTILGGGSDALKISEMMEKRVVFDLRYVSRVGGMDAARLLYNLVAKRIFDAAMKRGIIPGVHHVVVLEEASNLVPESYTRSSAADITTGESMVMLQRATGQGVIVVSTRPNISSNILANTSTKVTFRLPYDSTVGGRFMSIEPAQEQYLRTLQRGRALLLLPLTGAFEIETEPFVLSDYIPDSVIAESIIPEIDRSDDNEETKEEDISLDEGSSVTKRKPVFDRIGEFANHVVAQLASNDVMTQGSISDFLATLDSKITEEDASEILRDLVSLSTIQREAIPLVPGGFIYSPVGKGLAAVKRVIIDYLTSRIGSSCQYNENNEEGPDIFVDDSAILIIPEHLRASSFNPVVKRIRQQMNMLRNGVKELIVIIRGSVAAAKLREILDKSEEFDAVSVVSAFPSSLDKLIVSLAGETPRPIQKHLNLSENDPESSKVELIEAVHEVGPATSRAVQMRLWFGLIQDFVDISNGLVIWESLLEFIATTALQSKKGRSAPMNEEEGRRALTELLADEALVAIRMGANESLIDLEEGLWIVNATVLKEFKDQAVKELEDELKKRNNSIAKGHGYYDICTTKRSFVVFPTQQELNTLLRLHSDVACRICASTEVVCILTAAEYLDDTVVTPSNLKMRTMDDGLTSIVV